MHLTSAQTQAHMFSLSVKQLPQHCSPVTTHTHTCMHMHMQRQAAVVPSIPSMGMHYHKDTHIKHVHTDICTHTLHAYQESYTCLNAQTHTHTHIHNT